MLHHPPNPRVVPRSIKINKPIIMIPTIGNRLLELRKFIVAFIVLILELLSLPQNAFVSYIIHTPTIKQIEMDNTRLIVTQFLFTFFVFF
jgi:hypothetical protein